MGIVETVLEHVSWKTIPLWVVGSYFVWATILRIDEHRRIKRLGTYAPSLTSWDPLGLSLMVKSVRSTMAQKNLELWRDVLFAGTHAWTSEVRILNQRIVWTADPENIKAILATQFGDYGKGEPFHEEWKDFLGDSIFTTDGPQWHASRQLIRPQFTKDRVSDLHCFESHMETLFKAIANGGPLDGENQEVDVHGADGRIVEMSDLFFRYTLDITTDFLLGADIKSLSTPKQEFADAFNEVQRVQNLIVRMTKFAPLVPKPTYWAGLDVINNFVNQYIERALRLSPAELAAKTKADKGYTFLHAIVGYTRDRKLLRDQLVAVLLAGRDTTASTLSWTFYEFARHPEVVAKLRAEILETVGKDRTPTYEDLKNMTYLKAVLNETLRLYPVVPFNVRLALKDTTLPTGGGPDGTQPVAVTKNTPIGYSTLVMQRREDLYPPVSEASPDANVYCPERWATWHPKPHYYIPFNAGPRICVGQQFALTEMSYVLVRLLQKFDRVTSHMFEIDGGEPMLKAEIVLSPGQGVKVSLREAKD